jgi:hypothetical protein
VAVRLRGPISWVTTSWLAAKPIATRNIMPIGAYSIRLNSDIDTSAPSNKHAAAFAQKCARKNIQFWGFLPQIQS